MRRKYIWFASVGAALVMGAVYSGRAWATPANGFVSTTVALGHFSDIDVFNQQLLATSPWRDVSQGQNIWTSMQKTKGDSDLYVLNNVWPPGGDTGWHSHPGHSLIIVTAGTLTEYESDSPDCKPTVYTAGTGFVDPGGEHVHLIRNEGSVQASTITVQLIPANAQRRIDEPEPASCHI
jgi:quercetin dioxygenase-like cupin family protein